MDRPFRIDMFAEFANAFASHGFSNVLELGSGPGFLAKYLCDRFPEISLSLLDFSEAMHDLARARLESCTQAIEHLCRDFKDPNWTEGLNKFDCVFSNQAVHELRHKSLANALHKQVKNVLADDGVYLVCDHYFGPDAATNAELFMTAQEQLSCLNEAGFDAEVLLKKGSLQLIRATWRKEN